MGNVKISDLPLLTDAPDGSTIVGIHNGTPVRFPKGAVGGGVSEEGAISISTVKGLTAYVVNCTATTYMSSIKEAIESSGGDITRLNLVNLQGSGRGELLLIRMILAGSTSYYIRCIELNKLWSYQGYKDLSTTLISDFFKLTDTSGYQTQLTAHGSEISKKINSYTFNVTGTDTTFQEMIISIKAQGYTNNDPLFLKLTGSVNGSFVGYLNSWGGDTVATFDLNKAGTSSFYGDSAIETTVTLDSIFNTEHYVIDLLTETENLKARCLGIEDILQQMDDSGSSGGATLSMPRIRLANWHYGEFPRLSFNEDGSIGQCSGEIIFSVNIQDGTVQEGDQLQVCSIRNTFGKKKLRPILSKTITAEDIENLAKQPYLQISTNDYSGNNLGGNVSQAIANFYHTDSKDSYRPKPKYIRIRRPIYNEEMTDETNAIFSNVVPVEIVLRYTIVE